MSTDPIKSRLKKFSEKLPTSKDEYYNTPAARIDTIIGGDSSHYIRLRRCKEYYDNLADAVPVGQGFLTFEDFIREWYGVKMVMDTGDGGISLDYEVLDEQKYLVFMLKFSHES
jgi:hypothetical protein